MGEPAMALFGEAIIRQRFLNLPAGRRNIPRGEEHASANQNHKDNQEKDAKNHATGA